MECEDAELSLLITDDTEIQSLNAKYRGKDKPTDVLSFPLWEGEGGDVAGQVLGDVVISLETAALQAQEFGVSLPEELNRLLVHGLLHLLGYDHENVSDEEVERMRGKEEELLLLFHPSD